MYTVVFMWLLLSVVGACAKGIMNLLHKKVSGVVDADVFAWITFGLSIPILACIALLTDTDVITIFSEHLLFTSVTACMSVASIAFSIRALRTEQVSYIAPLYAFIPVFSLLFAWLFLGEQPPAGGIIGIAVIVAGAYVVNLRSGQINWYDPLVHLATNSGARYAGMVTILFAIMAVMLRGLTQSGDTSPLSWIFANSLISWGFLAYVPLRKSTQITHALTHNRGVLVAVTAATLVSSLSGIYAIVLTDFTAYALSVRRLEILFTIILGWKVLKDTNIRNKLIGGAMMTCGVVIVALL